MLLFETTRHSFPFNFPPTDYADDNISYSRKLDSKFSSVQFSHPVVSDSLQPHESQHTRPPCPSPTPGVHGDSRPSSQ